jgi:hypothetical protein
MLCNSSIPNPNVCSLFRIDDPLFDDNPFGLHYLPTLIERMRSARHELHAGTSRQAGILRYTEVQMVGWGVSPEFNLLKTADKQRASQKNKNPFRPLGVSYPPANT